MKKSRKLIISSLIALTGVTLASSVTATVAWFQNVTRVTAAYTGTTAHCSKLLQMAVEPATGQPTWKTDLVQDDLPDAKFEPITTGVQAKNASLRAEHPFYRSPDYRQGAYPWYDAPAGSYSQFTLLLRVADVDKNYGTDDQVYLNNDVYLTDLTIQRASSNNSVDLEKAVRVHFDVETPGVQNHKYFLFAKNVTSTSVGGNLDVNNDGALDPSGYEWDSSLCMYGTDSGVQTSYLANDATIVGTESSNGTITGGTPFGQTSTSGNSYLKIKVTIWLEGWALLQTGISGNYDSAASSTAIWDSATYAAKSFNVGMTFGVQPHSTDHQA